MELFGFSIKRRKPQEETTKSVVSPSNEDGAIVVNSNTGIYGEAYALSFDPEGQIKTEGDLIRRYRELSKFPEVSEAIEDIINEAIAIDDDEKPVELNLDDLKVSAGIKKKISDSFEEILNVLNFNETGYEIFERWYIDGKIYYQILFEGDNTKQGIKELRPIDPRKIKKIKNIKKEKLPSGVEVVKSIEEYYIYNDKGLSENTTQGVRLTNDSIILVTSGLVDSGTNLVQSHLQKAIKPANQLKMLEDAVVIYRMTRAPERRIFYVDVGNLPKGKAEQYVTDMMNKFKNKLVYDAHTGEIADAKRNLSMMEDFWMPRRTGGKSTEITTLPGLMNTGSLDDLDYFKDKLYHSLNVPVSRMKPDQSFNIGRSNEISRDEIKFSKFITKLRTKFNGLFYDALRIQLITKGIIAEGDWEQIKQQIKIKYAKDNHFAEMKEADILTNRLNMMNMVDPFVGKYYSKEWVQKNVLRLNDEDIKTIDDQMNQEKEADPSLDPNFDPQADQQAQMDQEMHDQQLQQKDELHQEKLKKVQQ